MELNLVAHIEDCEYISFELNSESFTLNL